MVGAPMSDITIIKGLSRCAILPEISGMQNGRSKNTPFFFAIFQLFFRFSVILLPTVQLNLSQPGQ
jgi:hypothetical protein